MNNQPRIFCISNRLPVVASGEGGSVEFIPSAGGLVTAMGAILRKSRGVWVGWPGQVTADDSAVRESLRGLSARSEFGLLPVMLDKESIDGFYQGFSNQIVWPLFHDLQSRCNFEPKYWSTYLKVQDLFSEQAYADIQPADLVWVHDYHLMGLGRALRTRGVQNRLCFFFHTPFPGPDIFLKLPWRADVMESMLSYDLIGFQTKRDLKNFVECIEHVKGERTSTRGSLVSIKQGGHETLLGAFPISVDFAEFDELARLPEVEAKAKQIRADMNVEYLVLGIDRLDYTKGIPYRIRAFKRLLEIFPELKRRIAFLQVVVPSRSEVLEYQQLKSQIDELVSQVNGLHGEPGWVPLHHLYRSISREDVIAMYRASDVALVTPLKDGMNLVAKEYCASRIRNGGMLVLSEFAGAADELQGYAYLVNPYDIEGVARQLYHALMVSSSETEFRMSELRKIVARGDVFAWARSFLQAAGWEWGSLQDAPQPAKATWARLRRIIKVFDI